MNLFKRK